MNPLDWAKERMRQVPQQQTYLKSPRPQHPQGELSGTNEVDNSELGKLFATLQRRGHQGVLDVIRGLSSTTSNGQPQCGFARRSNNKWLGLFKVLQDHVIDVMPAAGADGKDDIRAVKWLRRLQEVSEKNPRLYAWLMSEGQDEISISSIPLSPSGVQKAPAVRSTQGGGMKTNKRKGRENRRWPR